MSLSTLFVQQKCISASRFRDRVHAIRTLLGLFALLLVLPMPSFAQQSVVYGVFFYSPTCPHCRDVLTNHWPGIQSEFRDQLKVLFIDVTQSEGSQIMGTAIDAMHIQSNAVPMLIIGSDVMIGSSDIPQRAPGVIRAGLNAGGIGYPPIPNIDVLFKSVLPATSPTPTETPSHSLLEDPANLAALIVLFGLILGIGVMATAGWQFITRHKINLLSSINGMFGRRMALMGTVVGIVLSGSLVIGSFENPVTLVISMAVLAAFVVLALYLFRTSSLGQLSSGLLPLMLVAGILVAGYLTYVELTLVQATCGVVGNCNAVQQSSYAHILGIPVGVIGIMGYLIILSLWMMNRYKNQQWIDGVLFVMALVGVGFSIYLTILEPFVIGATCVWCLTSSVIMGVLLWMTAPSGSDVMFAMWRPTERQKKLV